MARFPTSQSTNQIQRKAKVPTENLAELQVMPDGTNTKEPHHQLHVGPSLGTFHSGFTLAVPNSPRATHLTHHPVSNTGQKQTHIK